ncbi:prolipoprotein diacylglyceryl transferase [Metarhizium album ARSEF 1941]|uniref:Prolipoprotein diacylglyceryl transferase n=1 Tax=Metarhizium album (strain ARSEF 1941) TaxID=1081103 RepID=A0A0B2WY24_METAS|nr:prolipoprotein diacylglyceryl transferase [Metarhizium album ARSEF 1941]KHO01182.1 prolipoprotein diacylglyceryl transferase [Metarhizium album ARSEF 1941]
MSLNGLDGSQLVEAYEAAAAEPGGWFLLKYESRDEIEVLSRGNGGIVEVRNTIAAYDETSPLYGFLKYRRRNVIIKYLPEDCSRIIQARVAVHFNAVCERFSPYDTIFEITTAADLKDSKLSAACSLHTASCSTSSSTSSLRRRRLMEIAEEEEEEQRATKRQSVQDADRGRPEPSAGRPPTADPVTLDSELASSPENSKFAAATTSEVPQFIGVDEGPTSPETDVHTYGSYACSKPKVKLGPRPSADVNGRPQTAGNFRPVSAIPAGIKIFGKGSKKGNGRDRQDSIPSPQEELATLNFPVAGNSATLHDGQERPATSSGLSIDSLPSPVSTPKKPTMSREKARLMKAKRLRDQKKKMSMLPPSEPALVDSEELQYAVDEATPGQDEAMSCSDSRHDRDRRLSSSKDDSGVVLETAATPVAPNDQNSDLTLCNSHPASPLVESSDADNSTKASSISESTDETVRAKEEKQSPETDGTYAHGSVGSSLDVATDVIDSPAAGGPNSDAAAVGDEDILQEPLDASEDLGRVDSGAATSTTGVSGASKDVSAQYVDQIADQHNRLGQNTPSLSEFAANGIGNLEENNESLTGSSTHQLDLESRLTVPVISSGKDDASPTSNPKVSAPDFLVTENAHSVETETDADDDGEVHSASREKQTQHQMRVLPIPTTNLKSKGNLEDGLQSAIVDEATPATVLRRPLTPSFPPSPSKSQDGHAVRTVSNPVRGNLILPSDVNPFSARSTSSGAAYLHHIAQHQPPHGSNLIMKTNVASGISARIKAFEQRSASTAEAPAATARERPSSTFFAVKKQEPSGSLSVLDRANSFRHQAPPSPERTLESSPEAGRRNRPERSGSVTSRLSMFEPPPGSRNLEVVPTAGASRGRPESISVTARIIRAPNQPAEMGFEPRRDPSEYNPPELKQSPLVVDHQAASPADDCPTAEPAAEHPSETQEQGRSGKSGQSSFSIVKGFIKERRKSVTLDGSNPAQSPTRQDTMHANGALSPRLSMSSHPSSPGKDHDVVSSPTDLGPGDDGKSGSGDKKLSRTGRFMHRLSQLSGSRSKNNLPATPTSATKVETQEAVQLRPSTTGSPTIVSYMGDVNVQFPDNLLWKRRNMCLDSQGYLILSALPAQNGRPAQGTKRYHLGDFRAPYAPDVEVQELPNSVVLDFVEGSGIQVACEDRAGQLRVLQTLQEAHAARGSTYAL